MWAVFCFNHSKEVVLLLYTLMLLLIEDVVMAIVRKEKDGVLFVPGYVHYNNPSKTTQCIG